MTTKSITNLPAKIAVLIIGLYQRVLSPDHSWLKSRYPHGFCRYYPSCSEYAKQAVTKFGLIKGFLLAVSRLAHCHPWAQPKYDPVPKA